MLIQLLSLLIFLIQSSCLRSKAGQFSTVVGPLDVSTSGTFITSNTIGAPAPDPFPGAAVLWFFREIPIQVENGFSIEFLLKVNNVEVPHNLFDAGIIFYGSTVDPSSGFTGGPRAQFIFFDKDRIGWGDESQTFAMDTTDDFHLYTLTVDSSGLAHLFVDGVLALQRSNFTAIPRIGFGDMTNDSGVNGSFSIGSLTVTGTVAATSVAIDIKPNNFPNVINPRSHGRISVAILSTDSFNATTVDGTTVRFGATGTEASPVHVTFRDVDRDGDSDMVLQFNTESTGIGCGDTIAFLTGRDFEQHTIMSSDSVTTVGCRFVPRERKKND
jgi:hypothetical protein